MHPTSMENMRLAKTKIPDLGNNITIVDVGGRGTKQIPVRSYQKVFKDVYKHYYVADINEGPGVTHIMPEQYKLPFADNSTCCISTVTTTSTKLLSISVQDSSVLLKHAASKTIS